MTDNSTSVPESRAYRHLKCQQETVVDGQSFEIASNPMSGMERAWCVVCESMFPIADYAWADTGETLTDYYARHSASATPMQRFLCSKTFMTALVLTAAAAGAAGGYTLVANQGILVRLLVAGTGLVFGAFVGMSLYLSAFANPIKRKVCGVNDTRTLR